MLFETTGATALELGNADIARLQRFFVDNPEYFFAVNGTAPGPGKAREELHGELPSGWAFTKKWIVGFENRERALVGMANVVADLIAPTVWHIGLFVVATPQHGSGIARDWYQDLEAWMRSLGAQWLRLGVVQGNLRAERFWERNGFVDTRTRDHVSMGARVNTLRVMVKPLAGGALNDYLTLVARDRPGSE